MEQSYTQAQLISFGNFLLNTERVKRCLDYAYDHGDVDITLVTAVHDADLANWSAENNLPYDPIVDNRTVKEGLKYGDDYTGDGTFMWKKIPGDTNEHQS